MADTYLVTLEYKSGGTGGGSMKLQLMVDEPGLKLTATAQGTFLEGTQHPSKFSAGGLGVMHYTGFGDKIRIGAVSGEAMVSIEGMIGSYLAPFLASFSVDKDWNGDGVFSVGAHAYECKVTVVK